MEIGLETNGNDDTPPYLCLTEQAGVMGEELWDHYYVGWR